MEEKIIDSIKQLEKYQFIKTLKSLPFVQKVILYGSRARGTARDRSDIDLAILCPDATVKQWHEILDIVEQADTLLPIDCVRFDELKDTDEFKQRIMKDGVAL